MEIVDYLKYFLSTETPFMLLFVALFFYTVKGNREREAHLNKILDEKLSKIDEEMQVLIRVWKILLEKELNSNELRPNNVKCRSASGGADNHSISPSDKNDKLRK